VLQHVALEIRQADLERTLAFWKLLGFEQVEPPVTLRERAAWG
jgi:catechol 2,3-dioxygenase-like lactoylglutathione lyase family enzyme